MGNIKEKMQTEETGIDRVTRSKEEAKANYDKMSRWYDLLAGWFESKYRDLGLQKLDVKEGQVVLEIGFGTGHCLTALAERVGGSGKVFGIDISEGMSRIARARVAKAGLSERIQLECGDAVKLPFETGFFNAVFMSFTLELFDTPEIPEVLAECERVLRSNGRISIVAISKKGKAVPMMQLYEWMHRKFPKYADCRPIYVQKTLEDAGLQTIDANDVRMWGLPIEVVLAKKP